jgi:transposase
MSLHSQGRRERLHRVGEPDPSLIQIELRMSNRCQGEVAVVVGLDVSAREISVARLLRKEGTPTVASFPNTASGHKALLAYLLEGNVDVRVCLEASGNYSLDLALALHAHRHVEVSLVNPRRARRFAESLGERSKSDPVDARVLCQWVAFSGLDPSQFTSGTSVEKRPRISRGGSRHLRRALYMPALVALRREPHLRTFYQRLVNRGKARLQALVAIMRKLLHALFAMFRSNQTYDGAKLCSAELASCA